VDVAAGDDLVVGRVEAEPAVAGQKHLHPRVARLGSLELVGRAIVKVAADVACGQADGPAQADHHVGEILADAAAQAERLAHVRVSGGDGGLVAKPAVDEVHDGERRLPGVGLCADDLAGERGEVAADVDEGARLEEIVTISETRAVAEGRERARGGGGVERGGVGSLDFGVCLDDELGVRGGDFEGVDGVEVEIQARAEAGGGLDREPKRESALPRGVGGLEADFVETVAYRRAVGVPGAMHDLQLHGRGRWGAPCCCCCCSSCWRISSSACWEKVCVM